MAAAGLLLQPKGEAMATEWKYTDGSQVITLEADDEDEALESLAEIVARDFSDTTLDDWRDA